MKCTIAPTLLCIGLVAGCVPAERQQSTSTETNIVQVVVMSHVATETNQLGTLYMRDMQVKLTTELSKMSQVVELGKGLFFFTATGEDGLHAVSAYLLEHTNLYSIVVFDAARNHDKIWYTGNTYMDLRYFPGNLNISNGTFAVFAER